MGVLAALLNTSIDAIDEYGKQEKNIKEGYDFYCDPETRSVDDITVRAGNSELVLAAIWKNLPDYKPSLPNMAEAFKNIGWSVIDTVELEKLRKENAELKEQIKKMKCCGNCKHFKFMGTSMKGFYTCMKDGENKGKYYRSCAYNEKWEM